MHGRTTHSDTGWIVGHNPGLSDLVERLTEQPIWLPTCGLAEIELHIDGWARPLPAPDGCAGLITPQICDAAMKAFRWEWWIRIVLGGALCGGSVS